MDMKDWFHVCDHCHVKFNNSQDTSLLLSADKKLSLQCLTCNLICSYQIVDDDTCNSGYRIPPATGLQHLDLGTSTSSHATFEEKDDGARNLLDTSNSASNLSTHGISEEEHHYNHRTLRNLELSLPEKEKMKKKYIIAESVSPKVALEKVNIELSTWDEEHSRYKLYMPGQGEKGLYVYDEDLKQICRVRKKRYLVRRPKSLRFGQVLAITKELLETETVERVRLVHYMHPDVCPAKNSDESMKLLSATIGELCIMLEITRESLNLRASPQGLITGCAHILVDNKLLIDCNNGGSSGNIIPCEAEMVDSIIPAGGAKIIEYVHVVEKDTIFHHLANQKFHMKNKYVLITGRGVL